MILICKETVPNLCRKAKEDAECHRVREEQRAGPVPTRTPLIQERLLCKQAGTLLCAHLCLLCFHTHFECLTYSGHSKCVHLYANQLYCSNGETDSGEHSCSMSSIDYVGSRHDYTPSLVVPQPKHLPLGNSGRLFLFLSDGVFQESWSSQVG